MTEFLPTRRAVNLALLAAGLAPACAPEQSAAGSEPHIGPRTAFNRGIGVHHMMGWPWVVDGSQSRFQWPPYAEDEFHTEQAWLINLKSLGFDFVRLTVAPAIFMVSEGERLEFLLNAVRANVERFRSAGLNVIVDLHPSGNADDYTHQHSKLPGCSTW